MKVDQPGSPRRADPPRPPSTRRASASSRDRTGQHDLLVVRQDEPSLNEGFVGARSDECGVRATADQQLDGLHEQGLARSGFAGERGHAGSQHERELADDPKLLDRQFGQHQEALIQRKCSTLPSAPVSGETTRPMMTAPRSSAAATTSWTVRSWTASSRMTPGPYWPRPAPPRTGASPAPRGQPPAATGSSQGSARRREMNDRSAHTRSTGSPICMSRRCVRSCTSTRGLLGAEGGAVRSTSTATTSAAPRWRRHR